LAIVQRLRSEIMTAIAAVAPPDRPRADPYSLSTECPRPCCARVWRGHQQQSQHFRVRRFTAWLGPANVFPYFGFRLLFRAADACRVFAAVIVALGVIVAFTGIWEGLTGHNPIVVAGE
jgi:hypothetical protein